MASYCHVNDTYINKDTLSNNNDELDKLARQVNNNKKLQARDIYKQYRTNQQSLNNGITAYNKLCDSKSDNGFYSAQGEYSQYDVNNEDGTLISDIYNNKKTTPKINDSEIDISLDSPSYDSCNYEKHKHKYLINSNTDDYSTDDSSSFSSISWSTKEIDRQVKRKSKFKPKKRSKRHKCTDFDLNSVDSLESLDSGESLLRHIRFCNECKTKIMELIRNHKYEKIKKSIAKRNRNNHITIKSDTDAPVKNKKKCNNETKQKYNILQFKEIITVCLIGIIIIIMLDLTLRND